MSIIQLNGQLGNQLFQYAFGRALSLQNHQELFLDTIVLNTHRDIDISKFNISGSFVKKGKKNNAIICERNRYNIVGDKLGINSHRYNYNQSLMSGKDKDLYYIGYRQSYKYFDHIKNMILEEITPIDVVDEFSSKYIKNMKEEQSVSIHIRRGDFQKVTLSTIHMSGKYWHTIIPISYYYNAINYIKSKIENPIFYVFSNDIKWCKENIQDDKINYVEHNTGLSSYKDMIMMSYCKHNIICNSTFSWRGAYLNKNLNKIVISPKKRYDSPLDISDLIPPERIKI